jgi:hypothetical protein
MSMSSHGRKYPDSPNSGVHDTQVPTATLVRSDRDEVRNLGSGLFKRPCRFVAFSWLECDNAMGGTVACDRPDSGFCNGPMSFSLMFVAHLTQQSLSPSYPCGTSSSIGWKGTIATHRLEPAEEHGTSQKRAKELTKWVSKLAIVKLASRS